VRGAVAPPDHGVAAAVDQERAERQPQELGRALDRRADLRRRLDLLHAVADQDQALAAQPAGRRLDRRSRQRVRVDAQRVDAPLVPGAEAPEARSAAVRVHAAGYGG